MKQNLSVSKEKLFAQFEIFIIFQTRIFESELEDESGASSGSTQSSSRSSSPFDVITKDELELELFRDRFGPELSLDQASEVSRLVRKEDLHFSFEAAKSLTGGQV